MYSRFSVLLRTLATIVTVTAGDTPVQRVSRTEERNWSRRQKKNRQLILGKLLPLSPYTICDSSLNSKAFGPPPLLKKKKANFPSVGASPPGPGMLREVSELKVGRPWRWMCSMRVPPCELKQGSEPGQLCPRTWQA
ncbi:uncharacterized protein LY79DRAFT_15310 [Colletotrichum navitas]|uniref:Secreted protein n=1 Tax=Colletotrichum navitas TaxID=681940 RepID=A0AAD8VAF8_9PEZI|nr:uncharacterized protein LY79DRAFT_15310 [Colletotrichum navitas]KAK1600347.1 hypothetical protein LY79DRAFT_15310 [Colletotrichum navitas]